MFDLAAVNTITARELDAIHARAESLTPVEWATEIPWLPGWTVLELLDHNGYAASQQAESFENMVAGRLDVPTYPTITGGSTQETVERLKEGRERLVAALAAVGPEHLDQLTPLPFGTMPTAVAMQIPVLEYAYHRWDLERAVGNSSYAVPDDVACDGFEFSGGLLPMLSGGGEPPSGPLAFELATPDASMVFAWSDGWTVSDSAPDGVAACVVSGSASDIVMFTFGRVPAEALAVSGDAADEASRFKAYFPGP